MKLKNLLAVTALTLATAANAATDSALYAQLSTQAVDGLTQDKSNAIPILIAGFGITIMFVLYSIMRRGASKAGGR